MVDAAEGPRTLEARDLAFAYEGGDAVLDGVALHLDRGELVAVVGPNGAGKTTLARLLAGILRPDRGEVRLAGTPLHRLAPRDRARRVAFVPQEVRVPGDVPVDRFVEGGRYAHLGFWRRAGDVERRAVARAVEEADLAELRHRRMAEMSSGQRQRALLARAMAQQAPVLLVDEPTTSLDAHHQIRAFEALLELVRAGRTALVVTHELNLASQFADRILLLADRCIVAEGPPDRVFTPSVLEPIYGSELHYGELPSSPRGGPRPFLVPWGHGRPSAGGRPGLAREGRQS